MTHTTLVREQHQQEDSQPCGQSHKWRRERKMHPLRVVPGQGQNHLEHDRAEDREREQPRPHRPHEQASRCFMEGLLMLFSVCCLSGFRAILVRSAIVQVA
jgi:hypothetical protein